MELITLPITLPYCLCGCGGRVTNIKNKYLLGHVNKGKSNWWLKGRHPINEGKGYENFIGKRFTKLVVLEDVGHFIGHRHFRCVCDCGKIIIVDGTKLKDGHTKSCGCIRRGLPNLKIRKEYGKSSLNKLIASYIRNAKIKGLSFNLTEYDMISLFQGNCFYCRNPPSGIISSKTAYGEYIYNGIDRLDNDIGYVKENVVSCCKECNYRKGSQNYKSFLEWINRVYENKKGIK